ncbi:hypothetical protein QBC47DRAFT_386765 [Echria macrotheca]|uniref:NAD-dependent epimerase/dehydratase domain-containing protein n=1 Tax=Echria macrotheca TaxID=438768 RepID=A0AAJ0B8D4_9PEZI|nr:hypothetical protein QBC47DRAFT_386765 [Echria macrotheca]
MTKGLVLVTGANGYIAARTVEALLQAGYAVRGTVRSLNSTKEIADALSEYADRLEFVTVPDITTAGAFDEAIKGVTAVAHLAAPVALNFTDPEPVLKGAIHGTQRVLESALTEPAVKSVVIMSSVAAVLTPERAEDYTYTDADWNEQSAEVIARLGKQTPSRHIYNGSKAAAEKAFWQFRDAHNPSFTMTAVNPSFVAGPPLVVPPSYDGINITNRLVPDVYLGRPLAEAGIPGAYNAHVDIRDVARIVVFGVEHPDKADGHRFLASAHLSPPQAVADILREAYPDRKGIIQEGTPGEGYSPDYSFAKKVVFDTSKTVEATGQGFIPWKDTVLDTVEKLKPILV